MLLVACPGDALGKWFAHGPNSHMSRPGIGLGWDGGLAQAEGASPTIWDKKPIEKCNRHQGKGNWTEVVTAWQPGDFAALVHGHLVHHVHTATEILLRSTRDILEAEIPTHQVHSGPCTRVHRVRLYVRVSRELNQSTCLTRVPTMEHKPLKNVSTTRSKSHVKTRDWIGLGWGPGSGGRCFSDHLG